MIALFGGSFDPVHLGHINNIKLIYQIFAIQKIIIVPCGIPPHKSKLFFSNNERLELLKIATKKLQYIHISEFEFNNKVSYTIETLKHFSSSYRYINFIMGSDSFLDLPNWDGFNEFNNLTNIIVINRNNKIKNFYNFNLSTNPLELTNNVGMVYLLPNDFINISSTIVRQKIKQNKELTPYLANEVINKINEYNK